MSWLYFDQPCDYTMHLGSGACLWLASAYRDMSQRREEGGQLRAGPLPCGPSCPRRWGPWAPCPCPSWLLSPPSSSPPPPSCAASPPLFLASCAPSPPPSPSSAALPVSDPSCLCHHPPSSAWPPAGQQRCSLILKWLLGHINPPGYSHFHTELTEKYFTSLECHLQILLHHYQQITEASPKEYQAPQKGQRSVPTPTTYNHHTTARFFIIIIPNFVLSFTSAMSLNISSLHFIRICLCPATLNRFHAKV